MKASCKIHKIRYVKSMLAIVAAVVFSGCLQAENSSSQDADLYGDGPGVSDDPNFAPANLVLTNNCTSCHYHSYHTLSAQELVDSGVVIKGDSANSQLYYRISGSSGPKGPKDMPQGASISASDVELIREWIDNMP